MCLPTNDLRFVQLPRPLRERIFGRATAKPSPYGRVGRGQIFRIGTSTTDWKVEYKNSDESPNNPKQGQGDVATFASPYDSSAKAYEFHMLTIR